jgi:hypothetical protein
LADSALTSARRTDSLILSVGSDSLSSDSFEGKLKSFLVVGMVSYVIESP